METSTFQEIAVTFGLAIVIVFAIVLLVLFIVKLIDHDDKRSKCYIIEDCPHWLEYPRCCMYTRCVRIKRTGDDKSED